MDAKQHYLLPCAFCGCTKVPVRQGNGIGDYWLECSECGASTKLREDGSGNEKDWNRRPAAIPSDAAQAREGWAAGVEAVATMLGKKADDYAREYGSDDMGSLSFGQGAHADAKRDYHWSLIELAEEVRALIGADPVAPAAAAPKGEFVTIPAELRNEQAHEALAIALNLPDDCDINMVDVWGAVVDVAKRFNLAAPTPTVAADAAAPTPLGSPAEGHWGEPEAPSDGHRLESDVDEDAQPDERAAFEAWYLRDMPHETYLLKRSHRHPEMYDDDSVEDAWTGWEGRATTQQANKGDEPSGNNALFARVTDWVNEHRIPFEAQNELFRILAESATWEGLFDRVALELNCLPSSFVSGNDHVFTAIAKLRASAPQAVTLSDEQIQALNLARSFMPNNTMARERAHAVLDALLAAHPTEQRMSDAEDAARLDWLREECCDLRSISVPTGGDDADVNWIVIQHHMAEPREREIGRGFSDDPRDAIDAARKGDSHAD